MSLHGRNAILAYLPDLVDDNEALCSIKPLSMFPNLNYDTILLSWSPPAPGLLSVYPPS